MAAEVPGTLLVPDTLAALQQLAREHRRALGIPILALTGSNGKTTTKELVHRVLSERFRTSATQGNLNNHIGVPLTLLAMTRDTEFGVVEMGASACGEIALLCSIAEPNYGLITNIGRAHLDGFGGPEGVRRGKGELYDFLAANGGRAFVCRDDDVLTPMAAERDPLAAEYYPATLAEGMRHRLEGEYNRFNIAAAVAVGRYFDIDEERIRHAVAGYVPDNHRSQRIETPHNTVLADCYNANPSSMRAAIGHFRTESAGTHTQKALILGDMLELGDWAQAEHEAILRRQRAPRSGCRRGRGAHPLLPLARGAGSRPRSTSADRRPRAGQGIARHAPRPTPGHTLSGTGTDDRRAPECSGARFHLRSHRCRNPAPCRTSDRSTPSGPGPPPPPHPPGQRHTTPPVPERTAARPPQAPHQRQTTDRRQTDGAKAGGSPPPNSGADGCAKCVRARAKPDA